MLQVAQLEVEFDVWSKVIGKIQLPEEFGLDLDVVEHILLNSQCFVKEVEVEDVNLQLLKMQQWQM